MKISVLDRLKSYFNEYFLDATKPTARNLFLIVVSILALDIFRSVRFAYRHVLSKLSNTSLNAYYYALKTDSLSLDSWRNVTLSKALKAVPDPLTEQPLFLSIDDATDNIGPDRQVFLLCDSWYPKGCVAGLVNEYHNLDIICNARIDTVMYGLPPKRTGKTRPPKEIRGTSVTRRFRA